MRLRGNEDHSQPGKVPVTIADTLPARQSARKGDSLLAACFHASEKALPTMVDPMRRTWPISRAPDCSTKPSVMVRTLPERCTHHCCDVVAVESEGARERRTSRLDNDQRRYEACPVQA